ncbi:hypothetical protein [Oceanihabitans sp. IOP_32]|nr:hypothetical protein [Oceanihabitans sp. IOP_32]
MKNILRLLLLIVLVLVASQVLFSDFEISKNENTTTAVLVTE